jgi:hypothetical protein
VSWQSLLLLQAGRTAGRYVDRHSGGSDSSPVAPMIFSLIGAVGFPLMMHAAWGHPDGTALFWFSVGLIGSIICIPLALVMFLLLVVAGGAALSSGGAEKDSDLTSLNLGRSDSDDY